MGKIFEIRVKKCNLWGDFGVFWAGLGLALDNIYRKFYRTLNNAKKSFNSIFNSIFLRIIHSKKLFLKNYSFKEKFIKKKWQLFIQKIIHLEKMGIIHSKNYSIRKKLFKKIFIQKNWKLFIQKNYSFFWKIDYRLGLTATKQTPLASIRLITILYVLLFIVCLFMFIYKSTNKWYFYIFEVNYQMNGVEAHSKFPYRLHSPQYRAAVN